MLGIRRAAQPPVPLIIKNNINRRGWPASCASGLKEAVRTSRIQEPTQRAIPRLTPPSGAEGRTRDEVESASVPATANPGATRGARPLADDAPHVRHVAPNVRCGRRSPLRYRHHISSGYFKTPNRTFARTLIEHKI